MDRARVLIQAEQVHKKNRLGSGIRVAVLDSGIWQHPDFVLPKNRIVLFQDFVHGRSRPYDDYGHGTHVAGIIAANGQLSDGKYRGVAPECELLALKILDGTGEGNALHLLEALRFCRRWRKKYGIKVVNMSLCTSAEETKEDATEEKVRAAILEELSLAAAEGMLCVASAGNGGPDYDSIHLPGCSDAVITVGAFDDGYPVYMNGKRRTHYSGRGKRGGEKPDLSAPGYRILSCGKSSEIYCRKTGTSMAAPFVSGACALLAAEYPDITLKEAKALLRMTAKDLGREEEWQGAGLLQVKTLLEAARKLYGRS